MINLKGYSKDEIIGDQHDIVKEGYYQITATWYEPSTFNDVTNHRIKWQIVGAPSELASERGKYLYSNWKEDAKKFIKQFLAAYVACGVYTMTQVDAWFEAGEMPNPDFEQLVGKTCICRVSHFTSDEGKKFATLGTDYYPVSSDIAKDAGIAIEQDWC